MAVITLVVDDGVPAADRTPRPTAAPVATPSPTAFTDPCGTFDTAVVNPYPVTGYWLIPSKDPCTWRKQLEQIHRVGGDTVIRLGISMSPRFVDNDGRIRDDAGENVDDRYATCVEDGKPCVAAAEDQLRAAHRDNRITQTYVYRTDEAFGETILRCPPYDKVVKAGKYIFHRLLVPEDGSDDSSCNGYERGKRYHLILIRGVERDSLTELLDLADRFRMQIFPALPVPPRDPAQQVRADPRHIPALTTLTRRIMHDYQQRFSGRNSLGGFYQSFEVQLRAWKDPASNRTLEVYREQHEIVRQEMPDKKILISPYLDSRKRVAFGAPPEEARAGFKAIAETGVHIIAPQDGRGTGKGALFWPNEGGRAVDQRLRPVVGESTNSTAYHASTREHFAQMAEARDELAAAGKKVELWANVEAFEPSGVERCSKTGTRGRTDKARLDQAVMFVGPHASKIISYMWSDFFTCRGSHEATLAQEVAADWDQPIVLQAVRRSRDIQDGVLIQGYGLTNATVTITWPGQPAPKVVDVGGQGWHDRTQVPGLPARVESIWVPLNWAEIPVGEWMAISVVNGSQKKSANPYQLVVPPR
ncbi:DUF4434 domain-containing protein [Rhizohabitans arisaemae]|uniref:DUF4434 domain-containing protein n=1 Tax=Rhizohabitans arisaemae TaxID=2720610 RepID=UPI0024B1A194|nr:DUF4434 domain-containing protein [Rhizohabitans arisaemae]